MNNVHPIFQGILTAHVMQPSEQDKQNALRMAMNPSMEMSTALRFRILGQYGTAEDIARLAESMLCEAR